MIQKIHILYIDSDPLLLDIAKQFLETVQGFTVTLAQSAVDALVLHAEKPFDAILSEYELDTINGIEFLKSLREKGDTTPFLFFTGKDRVSVIIEALNNGADFYLQKEENPSKQFVELSDNIIRIVSRRRNEANNLQKNQEILVSNNCLSSSEEEFHSQLEKISEQEALLRISEERLLMAQEIGQTGCWEYTIETDELWVSAEGCRIFGFPPIAGVISVEKIEACIPEFVRIRQAARDLVKAGQTYNLEYQIHPAD
jgi:DNA-binding response OmpR family regulator